MSRRAAFRKYRLACFRRVFKENPPKIQSTFSQAQFELLADYARFMFVAGYNKGQNDAKKGEPDL